MVSISKIAVCVTTALSTLAVPLRVMAQEYPLPMAPNAPTASAAVQPGQLEQLVAPIALYPDALLSQVLMASTYPIEVVEAARWRQSNPHLAGDDLEQALRSQDWDPSVKSLVAFPTVLDMMNDRINWTTELGDAFLAQQPQLMDTVQQLRYRAQAAGNLQSTEQQVVINDPGGPSNIIRIEPARPDVIYVPTYNPVVVYGPWMYPAYEPFYWYPPGYIAAGAIFGFGAGIFVGQALWGGYDWRRHNVRIVNVTRYNSWGPGRYYSGGPWQHDPGHRRGVGYGDGPGRSFYGGGPNRGPGNDNRYGSREQFRPQADQGRRNLGNVDRGSLQDRSPGGGFGNGRPFAGPGGNNGPQAGGGRGPDGGGGRGPGSPGGAQPGGNGGPQAGGQPGGGGRGPDGGGGRQGPLGGFQGGVQTSQGGAQVGQGGAQVGRGGAQVGQGGAQLGSGGGQLGNGGGQMGQGGFQGGGRGAGQGGGQPSQPQGIMGGGGGARPQGGGGMPGGGGGASSPRPQGGMSNVSAGGGAPRMEGGGGARFEGGRGGGGGGGPRMEGGGGGGRGGGGGPGGGGGGREGGGGHGR